MKYTVYVIYNSSQRKTYVGHTSSLPHRLAQHNSGLSTWTAKYPGTWDLIHQESFDSRSDAMRREKQLKTGGGRCFIQSLVKRLDTP